ncbi:hypothetical protein [Halovivax limisalsi]|uniref:hypothetical protein n=1 Tax=Halovivax limisalsi TaxID=1453760 RepID=UPI001FFD2136|nr:hypothetical protein [Halovivax limisalsi]
MERRKFLSASSTIIATGALGAAGSVAAATSPYENDSREYRDLKFRVRRDTTADPSNNFHEGAMAGLEDLARWMEDWMPYVDSVYVDDQTDWEPLDPIEHVDDVQERFPDYADEPWAINVCLTKNSDLYAARANGKLYNADREHGENASFYVNSNHIHEYGGSLTGHDHGYNFAVHESVHCMTFNETTLSGYKNDHAMGDSYYVPDTDPTPIHTTSVMATGYATYWQEQDKIPADTCSGDHWMVTSQIPDPEHELTACTANALHEFHFGEKWEWSPPGDGKYQLDENEKFP